MNVDFPGGGVLRPEGNPLDIVPPRKLDPKFRVFGSPFVKGTVVAKSFCGDHGPLVDQIRRGSPWVLNLQIGLHKGFKLEPSRSKCVPPI